jgi:hypothetical protein
MPLLAEDDASVTSNPEAMEINEVQYPRKMTLDLSQVPNLVRPGAERQAALPSASVPGSTPARARTARIGFTPRSSRIPSVAQTPSGRTLRNQPAVNYNERAARSMSPAKEEPSPVLETPARGQRAASAAPPTASRATRATSARPAQAQSVQQGRVTKTPSKSRAKSPAKR